MQDKVDIIQRDSRSQHEIIILEKLYNEALEVYALLHDAPLGANSRRLLSRSDNVSHHPGEETRHHGSNEKPSKVLEDLTYQILLHETAFFRTREQNQKDLRVNTELLTAINAANQSMFYHRMGDYFAMLCQDFKDSSELSLPSDRPRWTFLNYSKYSDLIAAYDLEQDNIKAGNKTAEESPLTKSLNDAYKYLGKRYTSVDEIVSFMRAYGDRNVAVHLVKQFFEEGNHTGLADVMRQDMNEILFLGEEEYSRVYKEFASHTLTVISERYYDVFTWEPRGYVSPSVAMKELRQLYEAKQKKKNPMFGKPSFTQQEQIEAAIKAETD